MRCVLGIDLGTTNFKFAVVDQSGRILSLDRDRVEYTFRETDDGRLSCELDVNLFARMIKSGISRACARGGVESSEIAGVSYASQANTFLLIDNASQPLTPFVSWQDTSKRPGADSIEELASDREFERTGLGSYSNGILAARTLWFQRRRSELWRRVRRISTISDYLCTLLTGEAVGDSGTAARLGIWDVVGNRWWDRGLEFAGIDRAMLPRIFGPGSIVGRVSRDGEDNFGIPAGTPVVAGSLDHHVAALGAGIGAGSGKACESTGTVISCTRLTEAFRPTSGISFGAGTADGAYYAVAFDNAGGAVLRAFRDRYLPGMSYADLDRLAALAPPGVRDMYLGYLASPFGSVDAFSVAEEPDEEDKPEEISDEIAGMNARGIMEAGAMRLRRLIKTLFSNQIPGEISASGGGGTSEIWTQIKADVVGSTFAHLDSEEPGCLGAAGLAGIGAGWHTKESPVPDSWVRVKKTVRPDRQNNRIYRRLLAGNPAISLE